MKIPIIILFLSSGFAFPTRYDPYHGIQVGVENSHPFKYQYGVKDGYSGNDFDKIETQDAGGSVQGTYRVNLPDGRIQIVNYRADDRNGFVAEVKYLVTPEYGRFP